MNWVETAKEIFYIEKPVHFTNYTHCSECAEHDEALRRVDVDSINLEVLGQPGWDPITFCTPEGFQYYLPALVRVSLESVDSDFYFEQFLSHLDNDINAVRFFQFCSLKQREFIADFVAYMIEHYANQIDESLCADKALRAFEFWSRG